MRKAIKIAEYIFILSVIGLAIYNIITYDKFFEISVFQTLTLLATVLFAFYFTQKITDNRKTIEMAEKIILMIQNDILDCRFCNIESQADVDFIGIKIRTIANNIDCLNKLSKKLNIVTDAKYISDKFNMYETLFGNHITQIEHLKDSKVDFQNIVECVDSKCTYIRTSFYI